MKARTAPWIPLATLLFTTLVDCRRLEQGVDLVAERPARVVLVAESDPPAQPEPVIEEVNPFEALPETVARGPQLPRDPLGPTPDAVDAAVQEALEAGESEAGVDEDETEAEGDAAASPSDEEGPVLVSLARETWVFEEPRWAARKLGYLRAGASVRRDAEPTTSDRCKGGWYRVRPRGFVCVGPTATLDGAHPIARLSARRPRLDGLPYAYAASRFPPPPMYARLPTRAQQQQAEPSLAYHRRQAARLAHASAYVPPPEPDAMIDLLAGGGVLPALSSVDRGPQRVTLGSARTRSSFALLASYEHEGRRFGLTTELFLLPLDRMRMLPGSSFRGLHLSDELTLPIAFVRREHAQRYRAFDRGCSPDDAAQLHCGVAHDGALAHREAIALTGEQRRTGGHTYLETAAGKWLKSGDVVRVPPLERAPRWARGARKWIDVSLLRQTLVAYEGTRPVFATLVSTGAGGIGDPDKTHATVQGTFLVHTKHVTVAMAGDEEGDAFDFRDVPFVQYFTEGYALHAAYWHDDFGRPRSHGCVNLAPADAAWLFHWTQPEVPEGWHAALSLKKGTIVHIHP